MSDLEDVLKDALELAVEDPAALAEKLLASLEEFDPDEADRLWAVEAERRFQQIRSGEAPI